MLHMVLSPWDSALVHEGKLTRGPAASNFDNAISVDHFQNSIVRDLPILNVIVLAMSQVMFSLRVEDEVVNEAECSLDESAY